MEKINWSNEFSVGIKNIDQQHKQIIELINELIDMPKTSIDPEVISQILKKLIQYAKNHIVYEEKLLEKYQYPDFEAHRKLHVQYLKKVAELSMLSMDSQNNQIPSELLNYLVNWWNNHILNEDKKYQAFLKDKGAE